MVDTEKLAAAPAPVPTVGEHYGQVQEAERRRQHCLSAALRIVRDTETSDERWDAYDVLMFAEYVRVGGLGK